MLNDVTRWSRIKSPWILHLNSGACNACDIEVVAALTPRFDVERLGVLLKATPRHADVIVATGPVTRQLKDRIIRIYEQTPDPKFVVAVGACAMSGCVYRGRLQHHGRPRPGHPGERLHPRLPGPARTPSWTAWSSSWGPCEGERHERRTDPRNPNAKLAGLVRDVANPAPRRIFLTVEPNGPRRGHRRAQGGRPGMWYIATISGVDNGESFEIVYHFGHDAGSINVRTQIPKADPHLETITPAHPRRGPLRARAPGHVRDDRRAHPRPATAAHSRRLAGRELPAPQGLEVRAAAEVIPGGKK